MDRNEEIAGQFEEIADRLTLLGESWFKVRAYRRAAEVMRATGEDVARLSADGRLESLPGIGEAIAQKTADYLSTGHITLLDRLREQVPEGQLALLRLGLTPAQVREVRNRLGAGSPESLRDALARGMMGLTPKTLAAVRAALAASTDAPAPG